MATQVMMGDKMSEVILITRFGNKVCVPFEVNQMNGLKDEDLDLPIPDVNDIA